MLLRSPVAESPHVPSVSRLCPREVTLPEQLSPVRLAMMVLVRVTVLPSLWTLAKSTLPVWSLMVLAVMFAVPPLL